MELTHSTRRFLKTAAPVIGSAGMLFAFYQWMVSRKGQAVEEMEYVQIQERELLKDLWNRYDMYRSVYQICDDYLDNDMMMTSQFIRKSVWDAYDGLLKAHNHFVEVVMWEMCEPEGMNAFLRDSRSDIYESEALLIELLRG